MKKDMMCLRAGKRFLCFGLTAALAFGCATTAFAEDYTGKSGWLAEFNSEGTKIECNFESTEVTEEASRIQPGDSMTVSVQVRNSYSGSTDWYMTNEAIQSLEDDKESATGGGYEYVLTYTGPDGTETLYDSTAVGGEEQDDGEGLHEATGSLEDYFYLDRLATGETGTVSLKVTVEGETQGNGYQDTLAKLQMNFAVEKVATTVADDGDDDDDGNTRQPGRSSTTTVRTGDTARVMLYCTVALAAGVVLVLVAFRTNRNRRRDERGKGE